MNVAVLLQSVILLKQIQLQQRKNERKAMMKSTQQAANSSIQKLKKELGKDVSTCRKRRHETSRALQQQLNALADEQSAFEERRNKFNDANNES